MTLTPRQEQIKTLIDAGETSAPHIGETLGISRNAVYQQIQRMRRDGHLPQDFTLTGAPAREERKVELPLPRGHIGTSDLAARVAALAENADDGSVPMTVLTELAEINARLQRVTILLTQHFLRAE